jgi:peptidoglycan lytic transglycosylase G
MTKRDQFRERVEARHKPRRSPLRLIVFLSSVLVCGGVGFLVMSVFAQSGLQATGGLELPRGSSLEQIAFDAYLRFRQNDIETRSSGTGNVPFTVQNGDTPATIGTRLQKLGLIQDADLFRLLARARGVESRLEAGDYTLQKGMTMDEILASLQHGVVKPTTVTLVEGRRTEEIAVTLDRQGVVKSADFIAAAKAGSYNIPELNGRATGSPLEGFLFPDTYDVPKDATAQQMITLMLNNFDKKVGADLWNSPSAQKLTPYQLLIIASIVEREAQKADERPIIASVYLNRIKKGMRLEADPTVQYAMGYQADKGTWWKTPVLLDEYNNVNSPYNTYLRDGLPPTPICNPGIGAIRAAFEPAQTDFLFFLGRGDGTHVFAKTFEEHQANIAKYQK